jgi:hypothetical protein
MKVDIDSEVRKVLNQRYKPPKREVNNVNIDQIVVREPGDGLDRLIDSGVDLFESVPQPPPAVIHVARKLRTSGRWRKPRFTELMVAGLAVSAAIERVMPKPSRRMTATQIRVGYSLGRAFPQSALVLEHMVVEGKAG